MAAQNVWQGGGAWSTPAHQSWASAQKKMKIDKKKGASCCSYFITLIILISSAIVVGQTFQYINTQLENDINSASVSVSFGGINITFDSDFVMDTFITPLNMTDLTKEEIIEQVKTTASIVYITPGATFFWSFILFMGFCCKGSCLVCMCRFFLILTIITYFFGMLAGGGLYGSVDMLYPTLSSNPEYDIQTLLFSNTTSFKYLPDSIMEEFRMTRVDSEYNITEILKNSPFGPAITTVDLAEFADVFAEHGIDIVAIFGADTVIDINDLSADDISNLETFATALEDNNVDVEEVVQEYIQDNISEIDIWEQLLITSGLVIWLKNIGMGMAAVCLYFFIFLTIQDRNSIKARKNFNKKYQNNASADDDW